MFLAPKAFRLIEYQMRISSSSKFRAGTFLLTEERSNDGVEDERSLFVWLEASKGRESSDEGTEPGS